MSEPQTPNQILIPLFHPTNSREDHCTICLTSYTPTDLLLQHQPCGSSWHTTCISTWLKSQSSCPICRRPCHKSGPHPGETFSYQWDQHWHLWGQEWRRHANDKKFLSLPGRFEQFQFKTHVERMIEIRERETRQNDEWYTNTFQKYHRRMQTKHISLMFEEMADVTLLLQNHASTITLSNNNICKELTVIHRRYATKEDILMSNARNKQRHLQIKYEIRRREIERRFQERYVMSRSWLDWERENDWCGEMWLLQPPYLKCGGGEDGVGRHDDFYEEHDDEQEDDDWWL